MRSSNGTYSSSTYYLTPSYLSSSSYHPSSSNSFNRTSNQHLRSTFSSPSTSSYVTRTHLPFVPQSTLVAHCFTGVQSSTRPYVHSYSNSSNNSMSYGTSRRGGSSAAYHCFNSISSSRPSSTNKRPTTTSSINNSSSNYNYTTTTSNNYDYRPTPSSNYSSSSYLSPSLSTYSNTITNSGRQFGSTSASSNRTRNTRTHLTTTTSSYANYRPIRLRERPLLTSIWRQLNQNKTTTNNYNYSTYPSSTQVNTSQSPPSITKTTTDSRGEDVKDIHSREKERDPVDEKLVVDKPIKQVQIDDASLLNTKSKQDETDWSSDLTRAISRNKFLIKFREIDTPRERESSTGISLSPEPTATSISEELPKEEAPRVKVSRFEEKQEDHSSQQSPSLINESNLVLVPEIEMRILEKEPELGDSQINDASRTELATKGECVPATKQPKLRTRTHKPPTPPIVDQGIQSTSIQIPTKLQAEAEARARKAANQDKGSPPIKSAGALVKVANNESSSVKSTLTKQPLVDSKLVPLNESQVPIAKTAKCEPVTTEHSNGSAISSPANTPRTTTTNLEAPGDNRSKQISVDQAESKSPDEENSEKTMPSNKNKNNQRNIKLKLKPVKKEKVPDDHSKQQDTMTSKKKQDPYKEPTEESERAQTSPQTPKSPSSKPRTKRLMKNRRGSKAKGSDDLENTGDQSKSTDGTIERMHPTSPEAVTDQRESIKFACEKTEIDENKRPIEVNKCLPLAERKEATNKIKVPSPSDDTLGTKEKIDQNKSSRSATEDIASPTTKQQSQLQNPPSRIRFREYNLDDFNFLSVLGHGGWGFVILADLKEHDACFAVKCIKKITIVEDDDYESILIERKVLTLGNINPFICKLFCTFETEGYLFFVMEFCAGGDLMFHVQKEGKFSEPRCRFYAAEIICAIRFLHNRHIIYRDLKLDNILLDSQGHVRLVDFGMCQCRTYREEMLPSNFCGTPEYISPEIIKGVPYNHSVDWWSFGVLLYEMAVGKMPFRGNDENELLWNVCYEQIHYPLFLSRELTVLLQQLLEREPSKRMGMATCKFGDIKDQSWFRGVDWQEMERMRVRPPFVPNVESKRDVQNFDADFTESTPELSPVDQSTLERIDQKQFHKFPYTNPEIHIFE